MFNKMKCWWQQCMIINSSITETQWQTSFSILPVIRMLSDNDKHRWRELAIFFMHHKLFTGAGGLVVTENITLLIALQARFPILN